MTDTLKVWVPSDEDLSEEAQEVLAVEGAVTQKWDREILMGKLSDKLARLIRESDNPELHFDLVPDVATETALQTGPKNQAEGIVRSDSLALLMPQTFEMKPAPLEIARGYKDQTLQSLMINLAASS